MDAFHPQEDIDTNHDDVTHGFVRDDCGIYKSSRRPGHRTREYDERSLDILLSMQRNHFWYRGRNAVLLDAVRRTIPRGASNLRVVDLGGGCGGWLEHLHENLPGAFSRFALGDSSMRALTLASPLVGSFADLFHIDLCDLGWRESWDVAFLLDVLAHIPDDAGALEQIRRSLRPGGLLFITAPALPFFGTRADDLQQLLRRYRRRDFAVLAGKAGLELVRVNYYMFLLSPLLLASRLLSPPPADSEEKHAYFERMHRLPAMPINDMLSGIFMVEPLLRRFISFPWGTSVLAILRRPPGKGYGPVGQEDTV